MTRYLAQCVKINNQDICGPLDPNINTIGDLLNKKLIPFLYPMAALVLFFILVWGGYDFLMSHGAVEKVKSAQAKITAGIVGFVLLMLSFLIVKLISYIFGIGGGII